MQPAGLSAITHDPAIRNLSHLARWAYVAYLALCERRDAGDIDAVMTLERLSEEANLPERWVVAAVIDLVRADKILAVDTALVEAVESPSTRGRGNLRRGLRPPPVPPLRTSTKHPPPDVAFAASLPTPISATAAQPLSDFAITFGPPSNSSATTEQRPIKNRLPAGPKGDNQLVVQDKRPKSPPRVRTHPHELLVDAVCAAFGATSPKFQKTCALAAAQMKETVPPVGAAEVPVLVEAWPKIFPSIACTPLALAKYVDMLRDWKKHAPRAGKRESPREQGIRLLLGGGEL